MNKNKIVTAIVVIAIIIIAWVVYGNQNKQIDPTKESVKIGMIYSQTGAAGGWGERGVKAAQMAVEDINNEGGVDGRPLELVIEDGRTDPKSTVSAFTKLASIDNVYLIAGDMWDFITEPMIPLATQYEKVLVSPTVMNIPFKSKSDFYFSVGHRTESVETAANKFFKLNPEIKTAYIFCWNNGWGEANEKSFVKAIENNGVEIVGRDCAYFGDTYKTQAAKAVASGADSVIMITSGPNALKSLRDLGFKGKVLATSDLAEVVVNKQVSSGHSDGLYFIDWPGSDEFVSRYVERYNQQPINEAQISYNLIRVVAEAYANDPENALNGIKQVAIKTDKGVIDFTKYDNINVNREPSSLFLVGPDQTFQEVK